MKNSLFFMLTAIYFVMLTISTKLVDTTLSSILSFLTAIAASVSLLISMYCQTKENKMTNFTDKIA